MRLRASMTLAFGLTLQVAADGRDLVAVDEHVGERQVAELGIERQHVAALDQSRAIRVRASADHRLSPERQPVMDAVFWLVGQGSRRRRGSTASRAAFDATTARRRGRCRLRARTWSRYRWLVATTPPGDTPCSTSARRRPFAAALRRSESRGADRRHKRSLEEIVVTALKRAESLQDAPATVTAFDAETVEQARIQSMRDYVNLTSNMTLMETQNNAFAFVNIRGLAQIRNVDPTVAVVVDGVLSTTSLAFSQELYDIQQIEVLKGPARRAVRAQRHGRRDQHHDEAADERARDLRARRLSATATTCNSPASRAARSARDDVLGRIVVGYKDADGWRDNVATGVKADPYEDLTVAGKLLWDSARARRSTCGLTYSNTQSTGSQFVSNAPNFVTGFPGNAQYPGNGTAPPVPGLPASITALIGDPNNTSIKHQGNEPGMDDREVHQSVGQARLGGRLRHADIDHVVRHARSRDRRRAVRVLPVRAGRRRAGSALTRRAFSCRHSRKRSTTSGTGQNLTFGQNRFHDSFSQELRITSPDDGACAGSAASTSRRPIST